LDSGGKETETMAVGEEYLAFLHDELSENQTRLRDLLGDSQSRAIFSFCADRLVSTVETGRYAFSPVEGIVQKLEGWGMSISQKEKGREVQFEIKCPYAEKVHPRLSSKEPGCPLGEYILGAIRLEEPKSQLVHNSLTKEGVKLTIEKA
jgi:hypothetical protein